MYTRLKTRIASLGLLAAGGGLVALAACSTDPNQGGPGGTGGSGGPTAGAAGAAAGGAPVGGSASGAGGAAPVAGSGVMAGAGGTGGGGGGGGPVACKAVTPLNGSGLTVTATDISAFKYAATPSDRVTKMAYDPVGKVVVVLNGNDGSMYSFDPNVALPTTAATTPFGATQAYNSGYMAAGGYGTNAGVFEGYRGIAFDAMGNLYVMASKGGGSVGVNIQKGAVPAQPGGARTWTTIVTTGAGFQASGTDYDHSFSGIAVSPDGMSLFFNSGSRTEHGEMRGALREAPLSSAVFKVPSSGMTTLANDDTTLAPFLFADGTRNAFDLEFNAAGDLIATENGPDIDLVDEVNFIEQGKHYGFPWRFGATDNPTRDAAYDRNGDKRLQPGYGAINSYVADPTFPAPPGAFTDPIMNMGPDANWHRVDRDATSPTQATAGLAGVTGHRSPLGLAFDTAGALCGEYYKQGFMLSYGALVPASLNDPGEDLLFIGLTKANGVYTMTAKKIATGIKFPMDAVLIGNRLFTLGRGEPGQIFLFVLPTP